MSLETNRSMPTAPPTLSFWHRLLCRKHRNVLLIAHQLPKAVDRALLSRADWVEDVGLPNAEARRQSLPTFCFSACQARPRSPTDVADAAYVRASDGMDGRRLRKAIISAGAATIETQRPQQPAPGAPTPNVQARRRHCSCPGEAA